MRCRSDHEAGSKDPASEDLSDRRSSEPRGFSPGGTWLLTLALTVSGATAQQASPPPPGTGLITGTVLDVTSGLPVSGIEVYLHRALPPVAGMGKSATGPPPVLTDSQGRFAFSPLVEGQYSLRATPRGQYVPVRAASVALAADQRVTDVTLSVGRLGSISGVVRDDAGDPVVGISVRAFNRRVLGAQPMLFPQSTTITDDRGQFRLADLPAAEYLVCACAKDPLPIDKDLLTRMASFTVSIESVGTQLNASVMTFAPTFHPGGRRVSGALPVRVGHGDNVTGISVTMLAVTPHRVSGQIAGAGPTPGTTYSLLLFPEDEDPAAVGISEMEPVSLLPDGKFSFAGVTPGRYTLEAFPATGKPGLTASTTVTVDDRDISGVALFLTEGTTARGRVEFPGGSSPSHEAMTRARVSLMPVQMTVGTMISIGLGGGNSYSTTPGADGTFNISGVRPGRYRLSAGPFGDKWRTIDSVRSADGTIENGVVTVPPTGIDGLTVTMSDAPPATLEGAFTLDKYESPSDSRVFVFSVDRSLWTSPLAIPGHFESSGASASATFRFTTLRPGDYFVIVLPQGELSPSPDKFEQWATRATTVTLRAGETTTVAIRR